jgi:O-antigen/teichoic acid export membrane protein
VNGNALPEDQGQSVTRRLLGFSWPLLVIDLAALLQSRTDEIVVGIALSLGAIAPYALARRLSTVPRMLAEQFVVLLLPLASELDAVADRERLQLLYLTGVRVSLAIAMPLTGCFLILAVPIVDAWVGPGFEAGAPVMVILAIATAIDLSLWPAGFVLQGINRHRWVAPIALASGLANLGLSLALAQPFGIVGVAVGTLIPTAVEAALLVTPLALRALGVGPWKFVTQALAPAVLPIVPVLVVLSVASQLVRPLSVLPILLLIALAHLVYGVVYLATPPASPERDLARDVVRSVAGKRWA